MNYLDTWIVYEKGGVSLGLALYELSESRSPKGINFKITYKPLYQQLARAPRLLEQIVLALAEALQLLAQQRIVHSDLKTENILVQITGGQIHDVRLVDYGSSFEFRESNLDQFSMATPEYISPELLNFIQHQNKKRFFPQLLPFVNNLQKPWAIDVWSLGCVLLEVLHGLPLWMSYDTEIERHGVCRVARGAFAVQGRKFDGIIQKQLELVQGLEQFVRQRCLSGIEASPRLFCCLSGMLQLDPAHRISPTEIIRMLSQ